MLGKHKNNEILAFNFNLCKGNSEKFECKTFVVQRVLHFNQLKTKNQALIRNITGIFF